MSGLPVNGLSDIIEKGYMKLSLKRINFTGIAGK
jgi:hypothetical protein